MLKTLARLTALAALVAACTDTTAPKGPGPFAGQPGVPPSASSPITMLPSLAVAGVEVTFTSSGLFEHEGYARDWDFGDGDVAQGATVTHVFDVPGTFEVRLVASDGATIRTASLTVNVAAAGSGELPPPMEVRRP